MDEAESVMKNGVEEIARFILINENCIYRFTIGMQTACKKEGSYGYEKWRYGDQAAQMAGFHSAVRSADAAQSYCLSHDDTLHDEPYLLAERSRLFHQCRRDRPDADVLLGALHVGEGCRVISPE